MSNDLEILFLLTGIMSLLAKNPWRKKQPKLMGKFSWILKIVCILVRFAELVGNLSF